MDENTEAPNPHFYKIHLSDGSYMVCAADQDPHAIATAKGGGWVEMVPVQG